MQKFRKGPMLTEGELRALPDKSPVWVVIEPVDPSDKKYKGVAYIEQCDNDSCYLNIGGPDSSISSMYEFCGVDLVNCEDTDMDGNLQEIYRTIPVKPRKSKHP